MPNSRAEDLRAKVDGYLRQALAEPSDTERATLLGKAVYWHSVARQAAREARPRDPWAEREARRA